MFLCAVAMSGIIGNKFNGKLGFWTIVEVVAAKRDSKKRKKGTPVIQPIESINREVILRVLIEKCLPVIQLHYKNSKTENHYPDGQCPISFAREREELGEYS